MGEALIDAVEHIVLGATKKPWHAARDEAFSNDYLDRHLKDESCPIVGHGSAFITGQAVGVTALTADAHAICALRNHAEALFAAARFAARAKERIDELRDALASIAGSAPADDLEDEDLRERIASDQRTADAALIADDKLIA